MTTYYVDYTSGLDSNPGTEANPWKTVNKAATTAVAGDTVIYEDDTWNLGAGQSSWNSGSLGGGYITHQARNSRQAIWEQTSYGSYAVRLQNENYIKFDGIVVRQATITDVNRMVSLEDCTYIELEDVEVTNCSPHCIAIFYTADHITINNCELHPETGVVGAGRNGILLWGTGAKTNITITNNEIYHVPHTGISSNVTCSVSDTYTIEYNTVHHNDSHGISMYYGTTITIRYNLIYANGTWPTTNSTNSGVRINEGVNGEVSFNVCYDNTGPGISLATHAGTVEVYNNTLEGNSTYGYDWGSLMIHYKDNTDASFTIKNNLIYHTQSGRYVLYAESAAETCISAMDYNLWYDSTAEETMRRGGTTYGTFAAYQVAGYEANSVVSEDPDFVDQAGHNFNLNSDSPAVDAGVDVGYDYEGVAPDIGRYEHGEPLISESETASVTESVNVSISGAVAAFTFSVSDTASLSESRSMFKPGDFPITFEIGDLSEWDSVTDPDADEVTVETDAGRQGTYGMQVVMDDTDTLFGYKAYENKTRLRIGFWFNPCGFDVVDAIIIAGGYTTIGGDDWRIWFEWDSVNMKVYAGATNDASGWDNTSAVNITDDWHWIEADFSRSTGAGHDDGFVRLWVDTVDETPDAALEDRDDDTKDFDHVCVGAASVGAGVSDEKFWFDYIMGNDTGTAIGPPPVVLDFSVSDSASLTDTPSASILAPGTRQLTVSDSASVTEGTPVISGIPGPTLAISVSENAAVSEYWLVNPRPPAVVMYISGAHMVLSGAHMVVGT